MGLTITIDSRTRELCENTGVPFVEAEALTGPITRSKLKKLIKFDPAAYDKHRAQAAAKYIKFLEENRLQPASFLTKIATQ